MRSGQYPQGNGYLLDGDGYCCLGVGRVVLGGECEPGDTELDVGELAELGCEEDDQEEFIYMNDSAGMSFPAIASVIDLAIEHDINVGQAHKRWEEAQECLTS